MVGQALPPAGAKRWPAGALALQIHSNAAFLDSLLASLGKATPSPTEEVPVVTLARFFALQTKP